MVKGSQKLALNSAHFT